MQSNIGTLDRIARAALASFLLFFAWWTSSWILLALSLFVFYEAVAGWCLFYKLIGRNSCKK